MASGLPRELTLREAVAFLCQRRVARTDERRIDMATKIAHFPTLRDLDGFDCGDSYRLREKRRSGPIKPAILHRKRSHRDDRPLGGPQAPPTRRYASRLEALHSGSAEIHAHYSLLTRVRKNSPK
jgi:hypothetical protein